MLDSLSYFNYLLEATPRATRNPWRTLVAVTRPEDFVVIKIDFDTVAVEGELVEQILRDSTLSALVDELYFEQHTFDSPHAKYHLATPVREDQAHLADSYDVFTRLRRAGIRAHSWI